MKRSLIVNADDFGQSPGTVAGVRRAHEEGVVTSASLMVRWPAAAAASAYASTRPELSVGLHLDLGEWWFRDGEWLARYEVVDTADDAAVRRELARQLAAFDRLMSRAPTHIDSHQHVHLREPVRRAVTEAAARLGVPVRGLTGEVRYRGDFYGQDSEGRPHPELLTIDAFERIVTGIGPGTTELGCHPGIAADLDSSYATERIIELEVLCAPRARQVVEDARVELISFHRLAAADAAQAST